MNDFLEAIEKNEELKAKVEELDKCTDATKADFIALAKEYGFVLTESDFTPCKGSDGGISDDELQAVSGGAECDGIFEGDYIAESSSYTCECVLSGVGSTADGKTWCFCPIGTAEYPM